MTGHMRLHRGYFLCALVSIRSILEVFYFPSFTMELLKVFLFVCGKNERALGESLFASSRSE